MAKGAYIGEANLTRKIKKMYLGAESTAHKVKKGYIGVNGVANLFFSGATVWKKYNAVENHTYHWNRFNKVETITYKWNRYNINSVTTYTWRKYNIVTTGDEYEVEIRNNDTLNIKVQDDGYCSAGGVYRTCRATGTGDNGPLRLSGAVTVNENNFDRLVGYYAGRSGRAYYFGRSPSVRNNRAEYEASTCVGVRGHQTTEHVYVGTVSSTNASAYPNGGTQGGYYYDTRTSKTDQSQGSLIDQVTSTTSTAYPQNGISGNYWYVAAGSDTTYSKGAAAGEVTSTNRGAYPDNNYSGNYWYVFAQDKITYTQGSYVADVEADDPNTYPDNGYHSDGYWYVKQPE